VKYPGNKSKEKYSMQLTLLAIAATAGPAFRAVKRTEMMA
jgi:hypothetical protein